MLNETNIERKVEAKMTQKFSSESGNPKHAIHMAAVAGAGICALCPIGLDVYALRTCEVIMIICIAALYKEKLTKAAARGIFASSFAQLVGENLALASLAAANSANILNPLLAYGIKSSIAVGLIEAVGHTALNHYKKKYASKTDNKITAFDAICAVGGIADATRIVNAVGMAAEGMDDVDLENTISDSIDSSVHENSSAVSFCGNNLSKQLHEIDLKIDSKNGTIKMIQNWIKADTEAGRDPSRNLIKLKYAWAELERLEKERQRIIDLMGK